MKKSQKTIWFPFFLFTEAFLIIILIYSIYYLVKNDTHKDAVQEKSLVDTLPEKTVALAETVEKDDKNKTIEKEVKKKEESLFEYIEVIDSCGPHFEGECLNARSGPSTSSPVIAKLRNGIVLKIAEKVKVDDQDWYRIVFDEWLRYPERVQNDWYVKAEFVQALPEENDNPENLKATSSKEIIVDRSDQKLYAYENKELVMELNISTGLELTPTPRGQFTVFKKTPTRYMQGPLPNLVDQQYYDLPGVPWNLYFTDGGAVIHGAYWHNSFGVKYSHGCVNILPAEAHKLYHWTPLGTKVTVRD